MIACFIIEETDKKHKLENNYDDKIIIAFYSGGDRKQLESNKKRDENFCILFAPEALSWEL